MLWSLAVVGFLGGACMVVIPSLSRCSRQVLEVTVAVSRHTKPSEKNGLVQQWGEPVLTPVVYCTQQGYVRKDRDTRVAEVLPLSGSPPVGVRTSVISRASCFATWKERFCYSPRKPIKHSKNVNKKHLHPLTRIQWCPLLEKGVMVGCIFFVYFLFAP